MRLRPLGGAEQAGLLAVPHTVHDGALWLPSLLNELGESARLFHQGDGARDRIVRAVNPRVVVISANHPLIRIRGARDARDHVVERFEVPVERQLQVHLRRTRAHVIGEGQSAAPGGRRHRSRQFRQQRLRVAVGNRHHRNLHQGGGVLEGQALGVLRRADSRSQRIAGINRHVHHASALRAVGVAERALGEDVALEIAVVVGVGVDQASDGAVLGRNLRLDAAPRPAVARDHDRTLHGDAQPVERFVIGRHAVVDVDQRRRHIPVGRVCVIHRQLLGMLGRRRVDALRGFHQLGREAGGRHHLEQPLLGSREQHVEALDLRIESPFLELREDPLRVFLVVRGPHVVRPGRKPLHERPQVFRFRNRPELHFPFPFGPRRLVRVAAQGS